MNHFSFCFNFSYTLSLHSRNRIEESHAFTCENAKGNIQEYLSCLIPFMKEAELFFGIHRILEACATQKDFTQPQAIALSSFDIEPGKIQETLLFWRKALRKISPDLHLGSVYQLSLPYNKDFLVIETDLAKCALASHITIPSTNSGAPISPTVHKI